MVKRPTGSGGEPSSPNCEASAGVKARHPPFFLNACVARALRYQRNSPFRLSSGTRKELA